MSHGSHISGLTVRNLWKQAPFEGITTKKGLSGFESLFSEVFLCAFNYLYEFAGWGGG